jgi:hypothetical protein
MQSEIERPASKSLSVIRSPTHSSPFPPSNSAQESESDDRSGSLLTGSSATAPDSSDVSAAAAGEGIAGGAIAGIVICVVAVAAVVVLVSFLVIRKNSAGMDFDIDPSEDTE